MLASTTRLLYLRVGVHIGNRGGKKVRFDGGRFSVLPGAMAPQPLFLQELGVAEVSSQEVGSCVWARVSAFRLKSAFMSVRLF